MKSLSDVATPLGLLRVIADENAVVAVGFNPGSNAKLSRFEVQSEQSANAVSEEAAKQLQEYFSGERFVFELPLCLDGLSPFSRDVLDCLQGVPFGQILSYGALAELSGHAQAARAVGRVMAANPIPIIVPFHRIVGSTGKMTGYSGGSGIATKEWLLAFERQHAVI
ncbi:MAG: cysteine methyltransferase [Desulfuromonas sp.]|nr:MAG: cysteine methyltransferase [Desulfuromonas sp.]